MRQWGLPLPVRVIAMMSHPLIDMSTPHPHAAAVPSLFKMVMRPFMALMPAKQREKTWVGVSFELA